MVIRDVAQKLTDMFFQDMRNSTEEFLMQSKSPVSFLVHVAHLPRGGMPVAIEADEKECAALAGAHGLLRVMSYRAELVVAPWKRRGVKVSGNVEADIVQECVVSLEPVDARIHEQVEGVFLPDDSRLGREGFEGGGEIILDCEGPDSPEVFSGDMIDIGAFAEEFFALGINPYPRKAGAVVKLESESETGQNQWQEKLNRFKARS